MKAIAVTFNCFKFEFRLDNSFDWLSEELKAHWEDPSQLPDLVAIGLQEFLPFNKAFIFGDNPYEELFQEQLHNALEGAFSLSFEDTKTTDLSFATFKDRQFTFVKKIRHVGNALFLFSKRNFGISKINTAYMGSGWFCMGNKGAVAIKCSVEGKDSEEKPITWTLCILSCHFDAHKTDPTYRNNQFEEVSSRILFEDSSIPGSESTFSFVEEQDVTILLGDLNYRVHDDLKPASEMISLYHTRQYDKLFQYEQLTKQLSQISNDFMNQFTEAKVTFPPTYKYIPGTDSLDETRTPSWCDRILFRSPFHDCRVIKYFSAISCQLSDHRPVVAIVHISPGYRFTPRGQAERSVTKETQIDSYRVFKQRMGATVDATAGIAVNFWASPLKIPFIVLSLFVLLYEASFRKQIT